MRDNGLPKDEERQERETTTAEKILAIALAIFLLVGGLRIVSSIDRAFTGPDFTSIRQQFITDEMQAQVLALTNQQEELAQERFRLQQLEAALLLPYEKAREEYRTLLDRGIDDPEKRVAWQDARDAYERAKESAAAAALALDAFVNAVFLPQTQEYRTQEARVSEEFSRQMNARNRRAGIALLAYALPAVFLTRANFVPGVALGSMWSVPIARSTPQKHCRIAGLVARRGSLMNKRS